MNYIILHDTPGRIRLRFGGVAPTPARAVAVRDILTSSPGIFSAELSLRTGSLLVCYSRLMPKRQVLALLGELRLAELDAVPVSVECVAVVLAEHGRVPLAGKVAVWTACRLAPEPVRVALHFMKAIPVVARGMWSLLCGRVDAAAIDGLAVVGMAVLRRFSLLRTVLYLVSAANKVARLLDERRAAKSSAISRLFRPDRRVYVEIALVCLAATGVITSWAAKSLYGGAKALALCSVLGRQYRGGGAALALPGPTFSSPKAVTA